MSEMGTVTEQIKEGETRERIARAQQGDKAVREALIEENIGLVRHIVKRFLGRGHDPEDLFQIGCIGLMKAIDKFDLSYEVHFSTYAVPMIQGEVRRFLRDDGMLKVSRTLKEQAYRIRQAQEKLSAREGREAGIQEIAQETGLTAEEIVTALEANSSVESIYSAVFTGDSAGSGNAANDFFLVDQLATPESREDATGAILDRMLLQQLLSDLSGEERKLIWLRYFGNQTQVEVAKQFGISQVQVSRMEKRILLRMREKCEA